MSKAAQGQNRIQMGTTAYLVNLNQSAQLTHYLPTLNEYNYHQALQNQAERVRSTIGGIYSDLKTHEGVLRYVPSDRRASLSNLVERLEQVCKLAGCDSGNAWACRSLLAQSGLAGLSRSSATASDLERAAALMQQGGESGLDKNSRIATVKEAVKYNESFAVGSDKSKAIFLAELTKGQFSGFLADLWDYYSYRESPGDYCGSNGHEICSEAYVSDKERQAFPNAASSVRMQTDYEGQIRKGLISILAQISNDVAMADMQRDYLTDENGQRLILAVNDIGKCSPGGTGSLQVRIEKLCWYTPVDPVKVQQLQRALNQTGMGFNLKEDGVYGIETSAVVQQFYNGLASGRFPAVSTVEQVETAVSLGDSLNIGAEVGGKLYNMTQGATGDRLLGVMRPSATPWYRITSNGNRVRRAATPSGYRQISPRAYQMLQRFAGVGRIVRIAGRVLLVTGVALEAIEMCSEINADLNDADGKLGSATGRAVGGFVGSMAGLAITTVGGVAVMSISFASAPALIIAGVGVLVVGSFVSWGAEQLGENIGESLFSQSQDDIVDISSLMN